MSIIKNDKELRQAKDVLMIVKDAYYFGLPDEELNNALSKCENPAIINQLIKRMKGKLSISRKEIDSIRNNDESDNEINLALIKTGKMEQRLLATGVISKPFSNEEFQIIGEIFLYYSYLSERSKNFSNIYIYEFEMDKGADGRVYY